MRSKLLAVTIFLVGSIVCIALLCWVVPIFWDYIHTPYLEIRPIDEWSGTAIGLIVALWFIIGIVSYLLWD